jgi:3-hydroxyisobutyrate dehydrogenase
VIAPVDHVHAAVGTRRRAGRQGELPRAPAAGAEDRLHLAVDPEPLHAVVAVVNHVDRAVDRGRHPPRAVKLPGPPSGRRPHAHERAIRPEDLDPIVLAVGNHDPAVGSHRQAQRAIQLARAVAGTAPHVQEVAGRREMLQAIVARVGHDDRAVARHGQRRRRGEPARRAAGTAPRAQEPARPVERLDSVVAGVGHVYGAVRGHGDRPRVVELAFAVAVGPPGAGEDALGVEALDPVVARVGHEDGTVRGDADTYRRVQLPGHRRRPDGELEYVGQRRGAGLRRAGLGRPGSGPGRQGLPRGGGERRRADGQADGTGSRGARDGTNAVAPRGGEEDHGIPSDETSGTRRWDNALTLAPHDRRATGRNGLGPRRGGPGMATELAFIGTGVMGRSMALNLLKAGHRLTVHNRTPAKAAAVLAAGARWAPSAAAAVPGAEIVITMVGLPSDVRNVYLGPDGIVARARPGALLIDMTTSEPGLAVAIHRAAAARGIQALDAPVSGGDLGARDGTLSIMVGGDAEAFDRARPVLSSLGRTIVHQGPAGSGQHTKLCNQIVVASTVVGVMEGLLYARRAGLDPETVLASISSGAAASWSLDHLYPRAVRGDFAPGFYVRHFVKDIDIALAEADRLGAELPGLALAGALYRRLLAMGGAEQGTQGVYRVLEAGGPLPGEGGAPSSTDPGASGIMGVGREAGSAEVR